MTWLPVFARLPYAHVWNTNARVAAKSHRYDDELRQVIARQLIDGRLGIDVGANQGDILAHMVETAPHASHLAVEPIPMLAAALGKRFPHVRVVQAALSRESGEASFRVVRNSLAESSLLATTTHVPNPDVETITVAVTRLDDVVPTTADVALIKLDTEGAEYWILQGGLQLLDRCRPLVVFEAGGNTTPHFGVTPEMFWSFFEARRYAVTTMRRWLERRPPFSRNGFLSAYIQRTGVPPWWQRHKEWMFLAHHTI